MTEKEFQTAVETVATLVDATPADILSAKRQRRIFFGKVVLTRYLADRSFLSLRSLSRKLNCNHGSLINRLRFYDKTKKACWRYERFAALDGSFREEMKRQAR